MSKIKIKAINTIKGQYNPDTGVYRITEDFTQILQGFQLRSVDRLSKTAMASIHYALRETDRVFDKTVRNNHSLMFGTTYGVLDSIHQFDVSSLRDGALTVNPSFFPNTVQNSAACQVGLQFHISGPVLTVCNGVVSGLDAVGLAYTHIQSNLTTISIAGGIDEISELSRLMHKNIIPVGEAAAFVILEPADSVDTCNSQYPEIDGYYSCHSALQSDAEVVWEKITESVDQYITDNHIAGRIQNILFSLPEFSKPELSEKISLKWMGINSYILDVDWMAASGVVLIEKSIEDRKNQKADKEIDLIICASNNRISILSLQY